MVEAGIRPVSLQTPAPLDRPLAEPLVEHVGYGIDMPLLFAMRVDAVRPISWRIRSIKCASTDVASPTPVPV